MSGLPQARAVPGVREGAGGVQGDGRKQADEGVPSGDLDLYSEGGTTYLVKCWEVWVEQRT